MKFSICLSTGYEGLVYPVNFCAPQDLVRQSQLAEKLGFDSVWGNDHITPPNYVRDHFKDSPNFYDVLITLAMIAQATTTLRVGTALLVMPNREPVYLTKQVATIDQMSGGRFMLAVGLGAYREEFEAWAGNRSVAVRRVDNGVIGTLMNLHKGIGMPVAWVLLVDTLAGSLILLSLSGLALWLLTHRRRAVGLAIFGSALALTVGLVVSRL